MAQLYQAITEITELMMHYLRGGGLQDSRLVSRTYWPQIAAAQSTGQASELHPFLPV